MTKEPKEEKDFKESRLSKRFSDLITKRVIIVVLFLIIAIPFLFSDYYFEPVLGYQYGI